MIAAKNLVRTYKIQKRHDGLSGYVKDLFKREYDEKTAVSGISFDIKKGEIVGYIGPNGAGKSTTIKMLTGILVPTEGTALVNGIIPYKNRKENAKNIGVVFGQRTQLWWDIPVLESLKLMKQMYRIPDEIYHRNLALFDEILELHKFKNSAVRQLSLGQRMRADLACALLHEPPVLYLDEPTIGLDIVVKEKIREFIKEINRIKETTIILTTHDMFDIEKLCSRVMVIDEGQIMYDGRLENLRNQFGVINSIAFEISNDEFNSNSLQALNIKNFDVVGNKITVSYDKTKFNSIEILDAVRTQNEVVNFRVIESNIDDIIRKMYEDMER